jgi:hypothetical protein
MLIADLRSVMGERVEPCLQWVDVKPVPVVEQLGGPGAGGSTLPAVTEVRCPPGAAQAQPQVLDGAEFEADRDLLDAQLDAIHASHYATTIGTRASARLRTGRPSGRRHDDFAVEVHVAGGRHRAQGGQVIA